MIEKTNQVNSCGCSSDSSCCTPKNEVNYDKRIVTIDFLYLDLEVCTRCQGTENSLVDAIEEVKKVLESANIKVILNNINVNTEELAIKYRFESSPTIRINGQDIQLEFKESLCESCGDVCGDEVDCRVWVYQGEEFDSPPKAMIIDAIFREVYGNKNANDSNGNGKAFIVPDNLKKFFSSKAKKESKCCE